jgi:hypothetical protein
MRIMKCTRLAELLRTTEVVRHTSAKVSRAKEWAMVSAIVVGWAALRLYYMWPYAVCCSNDVLNYVMPPNPFRSPAGGPYWQFSPTGLLGSPFIGLLGVRIGAMALITLAASIFLLSSFLFYRAFLGPYASVSALVITSFVWPSVSLFPINAVDGYLGIAAWLMAIRSARLALLSGARRQFYFLGLSLAVALTFSLPSFTIILVFLLLAATLALPRPAKFLDLLLSFVRYSLSTAMIVGSYGVFFWLQVFLTSGRGIANTPNASPFTVSGLVGVLVWIVISYSNPLWLALFIFSLWEALRLLRRGDGFLLSLYLSLVVGIFVALFPFPDRLTLYLWAPILLGFGLKAERQWRGSGPSPAGDNSEKAQT